jgi:hypothetical protein
MFTSQIEGEVKNYPRVIVHRDFNLDLDGSDDGGYYMAAMLKSLFKQHLTCSTWCSF